MSETLITVQDAGQSISYSYAEMMKYHGPGFPGGVAHAFKVMELAFPALAQDQPVERRSITIRTPFSGPGARDAFEMVTRVVTEGRYTVDPTLAQTQRGFVLQAYHFELASGERRVVLQIRPGHVREEFRLLAQKPGRTAEEEDRLTWLKQEMADRLMALPAGEIYEIVG